MGKLFRMLFALIGYFCTATVLSQGIILGLLVFRWGLNADRLADIVLAAKGEPLPSATPPPAPPKEEPVAEQVSFDRILEVRAVKEKNLQLREQALTNSLAQLRVDQRKLTDEEGRYKQHREDYEKKLATAVSGAKASGMENSRSLLQALKPKQAKEFLLGMLNNKQLDDVVALLAEMPNAKRAKIIAEFKTPEDVKKMETVLDLIRQGSPEGPLAGKAKDQLNAPPQAPSP